MYEFLRIETFLCTSFCEITHFYVGVFFMRLVCETILGISSSISNVDDTTAVAKNSFCTLIPLKKSAAFCPVSDRVGGLNRYLIFGVIELF